MEVYYLAASHPESTGAQNIFTSRRLPSYESGNGQYLKVLPCAAYVFMVIRARRLETPGMTLITGGSCTVPVTRFLELVGKTQRRRLCHQKGPSKVDDKYSATSFNLLDSN